MILYHFTSTLHWPRIEAAGFIKTTESNLHPVQQHYGPDVAWFLDTPDLDYDHGLIAFSPVDKTAVRITVDVPDKWVRSWLDWADAQGIDPDWRSIMIETGGGIDAARHWMVTFRPIRSDRWTHVDHPEAALIH